MTARNNNKLVKWIKAGLIALILAIILNTFIFSSSIFEGISMESTFKDNDRILINKLTYILSEPNRGDLVIIQQEYKNYKKRIIAIYCDTIKMIDNTLNLDNEEQENTYVNQSDEILTGSFGPLKIADDHYFVMGDNRLVSKDSRNELGLIKQNEIIGKSEFIIYPFDRLKKTK